MEPGSLGRDKSGASSSKATIWSPDVGRHVVNGFGFLPAGHSMFGR